MDHIRGDPDNWDEGEVLPKLMYDDISRFKFTFEVKLESMQLAVMSLLKDITTYPTTIETRYKPCVT